MSTLTADLPLTALDQNLPCLRCGYNLRTLSTTGQCPECSTPIASSLNTALLRYSNPSWTSVLALAMGIMFIAASIEILVILTVLVLFQFVTLFSVIQFVVHVHSFANPLFWLAAFLLGRAEPNPPSSPRRLSFRRPMRIAALIALLSAIFADSNALDVSAIVPFKFPVGELIELLATILLYAYLVQLAHRAGLPSLRRHTRVAMLAMIVALCIWAFLDVQSSTNWSDKVGRPARLLLMPAFIYQLFIFYRFRRTLRQSTHLARQYWHFCSPVA